MTTMRLSGVAWRPSWVTFLGCLGGCLDYLDARVSEAWLYGISGHAFLMNVHDRLCPSGPTAWRSDRMVELCANAGCAIETVSAQRAAEGDFAERQREAWLRVRSAIDAGRPCIGWELEIPEFYVIDGYDETGYFYSGVRADGGKGPKPWQELGKTPIGWLAVFDVGRAAPPPDRVAVREALRFALDFARSPTRWTFPRYATGLDAYAAWIAALRSGEADPHGAAYNAAVWSECRDRAAAFLAEARDRLPDLPNGLLDEAHGAYAACARELSGVARSFPMIGASPEQRTANVRDAARCATAISALERAREAEARGLEALSEIVSRLES